ncbi:VOC family protein [Streptomyces sp. NPDC051976]|uniref:VOC family protein n=1 Tax=Streptomyces sp. NPDC051976 TaxID=3154947 RepID=UPI00341AF7CB
MPGPPLAGIHHVKIPVTDLDRSLAFYSKVFGLTVEMEFPDSDGVVRGVAGRVPGLGETLLALRVNPAAAQGCADFDPVSFAVTGQAEIQDWAAHLDELAIDHSPVIEASVGWLLVFTDPDGLQLHLYSWAAHGIDHSDKPGYGRAVTAST